MIGLLQCDHVRDEFRHIGGDYDDMFQRWLDAHWRIYRVVDGEVPRHIGECDAYVSTGSRASVYDDEPWIHRLAGVVREIHAAGVPMLGVCFGHQMIAHALGGRVAKCSRGWSVGVHQFRVERREAWMQPRLENFGLVMS
jgi:GMP synthase-like glutamine amidotransferase